VAGKLKVGFDPDVDLRRVRIIEVVFRRNTSKPGLMLDANESWQVKQAVRYVGTLEEHVDLLWVEEPLRRWDAIGHARLSGAVRAAVATGENLTGVEQFRPLFDAGAPDVVQAGAVWGVTHLLRLAAVAAARDLPVSPVGYNANPAVAHVMSAIPNHLTTEVQGVTFAAGVVVDHQFVDGGIVLSDAPGSGITIDTAAIATAASTADWPEDAGPHVRPERAGLRLLLDGVER
jgi:L-alanine-DL-glutamate epimerase-like enolase superfamily enzyme